MKLDHMSSKIHCSTSFVSCNFEFQTNGNILFYECAFGKLKEYGRINLDKGHEDQLVRWFEGKIRGLHTRG
jgi:hypothetical protein